GIPGAGKSTYVRQLDLSNTLLLNCDDTMERMSGYQRDKAAFGNEAAFRKWELCARELTYEALFRAVDLGLNIVLDFNGANFSHIEMLDYMKKDRGYKVPVTALLVDEELALGRTKTRDRYVPPEYMPERKKIIEGLLPD